MQEKLKQLELLVSQLLARQQEGQAQNVALKQRVRTLEDNMEKFKAAEAELRALKDWKKNAQGMLKRLSVKIEKELAKSQEESNFPS